jgi:folate-binding protein YgfZ
MLISLPDLRLLEITGADAVNFAHAQFSSDVRGLENGGWQWSAWLSPQGRVRAFFQLMRNDEHLRLVLRGGDAEELRTQLARYVLRAKVDLRAVGDERVFGTDAAADGALALPGAPGRWLVLRQTPQDAHASAAEAWRLADIRAGLAVLAPNLLDQLLPQALGLNRLGAVSVAKGCYPGQEVMSRLHFKGGNKRSLYQIRLTAGTAPTPGAALLTTSTSEVGGQVIMSAQVGDGSFEALASLTDAAADAPLHGENPAFAEVSVVQRFA